MYTYYYVTSPIIVSHNYWLLSLFNSSFCHAVSWLTDYSYRKKLTFDHTDSPTNNYQIQLTLHASSGTDTTSNIYLGSTVSADFKDIRFTNSSGDTLLDYWIESISGDTATVWVSLDSLETSSTNIFYLYYVNSQAVSASSASDTFHFYDYFDDGSGIGGWTGSALLINSGGEYGTQTFDTTTYQSSPGSAKLNSYASCFSSPYDGAASVLTKTLSLASGNYTLDYMTRVQITGFRYSTSAYQASQAYLNGSYLGNTTLSCSGSGCSNTGSWTAKQFNVTNTAISSLAFRSYSGDCTDGNINIDNVRIRTYSPTPPSLSTVGTQETPPASPAPTATSQAPVAENSTTTPNTYCAAFTPNDSPAIFQIDQTPDSATLHFVPITSNITGYTISYGPTSSADSHSVSFDQQDNTGAITYTINHLTNQRSWYFKIRANNGCQPGEWGSVRSINYLPTPIPSYIPYSQNPPFSSAIVSPAPPLPPSPPPNPTVIINELTPAPSHDNSLFLTKLRSLQHQTAYTLTETFQSTSTKIGKFFIALGRRLVFIHSFAARPSPTP